MFSLYLSQLFYLLQKFIHIGSDAYHKIKLNHLLNLYHFFKLKNFFLFILIYFLFIFHIQNKYLEPKMDYYIHIKNKLPNLSILHFQIIFLNYHLL